MAVAYPSGAGTMSFRFAGSKSAKLAPRKRPTGRRGRSECAGPCLCPSLGVSESESAGWHPNLVRRGAAGPSERLGCKWRSRLVLAPRCLDWRVSELARLAPGGWSVEGWQFRVSTGGMVPGHCCGAPTGSSVIRVDAGLSSWSWR